MGRSLIENTVIIIIIAVISIAPYLTDKGGHIAIYKIDKNDVYVIISKIITI